MSGEPTGFLYPFIEAEERDGTTLLLDLTRSADTKMRESAALRVASLERWDELLEQAGASMASRFDQGGRLGGKRTIHAGIKWAGLAPDLL